MEYDSDHLQALLSIIAQNIVKLRKQHGLTQDELAFKAGIDRTYMGYIENSKHNITLGMLLKIAYALNTTFQHLTSIPPETKPINKLNFLFKYIQEYQEMAEKTYEINDIFQDNGGKLLQVLLVLGLVNMSKSQGNDAVDRIGNEYILKSVNIKQTKSFSTQHHLNPGIISKYRKVDWIFAVYSGIELLEIYQMKPASLEPYFLLWIDKHKLSGDINNPKIPLTFVRANGTLIYNRAADGLFHEALLE
jgi:transcriptional regulator with XRE-family HTH domain